MAIQRVMLLFVCLFFISLLGCGLIPETYILTIEKDGEGEVEPAVGPHEYRGVTIVDLEAEPLEGWEFYAWEGDVTDRDKKETSIVVDQDTYVKAFFQKIPGPEYTLTLSTGGSGDGTITLDGTIVSEGSVHTFEEGTIVELKADPSTGSSFSYWQGDFEEVESTVEILIDSDMDIVGIFSYFTSGSGAETDPYVITTPGELSNMRRHLSRHFRLEAMIDLHIYSLYGGWEPIGQWTNHQENTPFTGSLDGNGYSIVNLLIDRPEEDGVGLFACVGEEGRLESVRLDLVEEVTGRFHVGALAGVSYGSIDKSSADGRIGGEEGSVGGLVGWNGGSIDKSEALGDVEGRFNIGGLVGFNGGTITYSFGIGSVMNGSSAGGLVGRNEGEIISSNAQGSIISSFRSIGGLVGTNWSDSTIEKSYASGSVEGNEEVGGLVGSNNGSIDESYALGDVAGSGPSVGGLVGKNTFEISSSYARGSVHGERRRVGGLVGSNDFQSSIENSYAKGEVQGSEEVGGLVGYNQGEILYSYAAGSVDGSTWVGGLVGVKDTYSSITNSYYDSEETGQSDTGKGEPKTTEEMKQEATFIGWDFHLIWDIEEEVTYPFLRWE